MEKSKLNQTIEELKLQYRNFKDEIAFQVLEKYPFIIEVGALTISTDERGKVITQNSNHPTQFTQKAVDEILTMTFRNGNNEKVKPVVYGRNDWYKSRMKVIEESIELFQSTLLNNPMIN